MKIKSYLCTLYQTDKSMWTKGWTDISPCFRHKLFVVWMYLSVNRSWQSGWHRLGLPPLVFLFATLIFWTIGLVFRREKVNAKDLMVIALGGISGVACTYLSFAWGLNYTTPVHFALIVALNPIVVMLFSVLFLKEAINRRKLTGVLLGIAGAWVLISQMDIAASVENHILGIVFAIVNTVMLGFYLIIIRRVAIKYSPVTLQKMDVPILQHCPCCRSV